MPTSAPNPTFRLTPPDIARKHGLVALGGGLGPSRLIWAYSRGLFPWYNPGEPILWWSPDPRLVLYPAEIHISRRLRRTLRQGRFKITADTAFERVIAICAKDHTRRHGATWIGKEMIKAYTELHKVGLAHSFEAWQDGRLAGGLYGVSLGRCFFGESMFTRITDASKVILVTLARQLQRWRFAMIDCQVVSDHLIRMGACAIPRRRFLEELDTALRYPHRSGKWRLTK